MNYWLMKSEPHVYPWEMLVKDKKTHWDGVRNYQARNMMRDEMKLGDLVFFYHSNFKPPHVAGVARICREGYPDFTAQDPDSKYFDEKNKDLFPENFAKPIYSIKRFEEARIELLNRVQFSWSNKPAFDEVAAEYPTYKIELLALNKDVEVEKGTIGDECKFYINCKKNVIKSNRICIPSTSASVAITILL